MLSAPWRIELFGGLRAIQVGSGSGAGRTVTRFRTQMTGALLAYLAYYRGRSHSREVLISLLWPDASLESGRHSLSLALSSLRSQLEPPGESAAGAVIVADRLTVALNSAAFTTDTGEFEDALKDVARIPGHDVVARLAGLAAASEQYGGRLLAGYYDDWILGEQQRLEGLYRDAVHQLVTLALKLGRAEEALPPARKAANTEGGDIAADETAHQDVARLLIALGDGAGALRQLRTLEEYLARSGESPTSATRAIRAQAERTPGASQSPTPPLSPSPLVVTAAPDAAAGVASELPLSVGTITVLSAEIAGAENGDPVAMLQLLLHDITRRAGGVEVNG